MRPFTYLRKEGGSCFFFFSLIKKMVKRMEARQKIGKAKNAAYQKSKANKEPIMGLTTFPKPFDASTKPKTLLCSPPLNKSPVKAIAMDVVPAAPIPCIILPARIHVYALENQAAAAPAKIPPLPYKIRAGMTIAFLENLSDK